jgi:hypothetical protein
MHRVYNSAFMNMLKREDNDKYRTTIKNTIEFDPEILKRYVNFMNNPDEETAVTQFGRDDKYFGVCTMMVAMPGLPMFGHGQIEGFEEKYGMEYRRAYRDEKPDDWLVDRHRREIFPLMKKRWLFAGVENFRLYDFYDNGRVNENVFAWSNRAGGERALILYNNKYEQATGWIKNSAAFMAKNPDGSKALVQRPVAEGLRLTVRDGRFCVMQEQRSGLWYLRTTREINDNGFFASLNGFQTQVFVNIHEVDDADGKYRALYDSLGGRGITDIHMGIQNIFLKDLYSALSALATPEYFRGFREKADKKNLMAIETAATAFFAKCEEFIEGEYGAQGIEGMVARKKPAKGFEKKTAEVFVGTVTKLVNLSEGPETPAMKKTADEQRLVSAFHALLAKPGMAESAGAALILAAIRHVVGTGTPGTTARALVERWSLDRKLADIMAERGFDEVASLGNIRSFVEMLPLADVSVPKSKKPLEPIFANLLESERAKKIIGAHSWDGVEWFHKEAAETFTDIGLLAAYAVGIPESVTETEIAALAKARKSIFEILLKSEYRIANIPVPAKKTGPEKNADDKKKTAKKSGKSEEITNKKTPAKKTKKE